VVGEYFTGEGGGQTFMWRHGRLIDAPDIYPAAINAAGAVVGLKVVPPSMESRQSTSASQVCVTVAERPDEDTLTICVEDDPGRVPALPCFSE